MHNWNGLAGECLQRLIVTAGGIGFEQLQRVFMSCDLLVDELVIEIGADSRL